MQKNRPGDVNWGERELIRRIQEVNAEESTKAFAELYDMYSPKVKQQIIRKGISVTDAETIESDVWMYIYENIDDYQYQGKSIWRWISKIVVYKVKEFWHAQKTLYRREKSFETDDDGATITSCYHHPQLNETTRELEQTQLNLLIRQALATLDNRLQHDIIVLRYFADLKLAEIAAELDQNLNTVKVYHRRAIQKLREFPGLEELQS